MSRVDDCWLQRAWSAYVNTHGDTVFTRIVIGWLLFVVFFWTYGGALTLVVLRGRPAAVFERRHQRRRAFSSSSSAHAVSLRACVANVLVNQLVVIPAGLLAMDAAAQRGWLRGIDMSERLPSPARALATTLAALALVETFFYWSHRALHSRALYARVHKTHHMFKAPYAIAAVYAHPLEALVGNTLAVMGPAFVVGMHGALYYVAIVVGWAQTLHGHSGIDVPLVGSRAHDLHHERLFGANLGSFGFWDRVCGTDGATYAARRLAADANDDDHARATRPAERRRAK